jgi:type VI secretion system protein ImpF
MPDQAPVDRLQPALLDRLQDDDPTSTVEPPERRSMTKRELRAAVLRDLRWLFNTTRLEVRESVRGGPRDDFSQSPHVRRSVVNYGLPPLSGRAASSLEVDELERGIRQAIIDFEPRILPQSLRVTALIQAFELGRHNVIGVEIQGMLWSQPVPIEVLLRTEIDLESGTVDVKDSIEPTPVQAF